MSKVYRSLSSAYSAMSGWNEATLRLRRAGHKSHDPPRPAPHRAHGKVPRPRWGVLPGAQFGEEVGGAGGVLFSSCEAY